MVEITEEELAAEALAADPDSPVDDDAVPLAALDAAGGGQLLLPDWYMPAPARPLRGWARWVVAVIVASFLAINAYGLCSTYGYVGFD